MTDDDKYRYLARRIPALLAEGLAEPVARACASAEAMYLARDGQLEPFAAVIKNAAEVRSLSFRGGMAGREIPQFLRDALKEAGGDTFAAAAISTDAYLTVFYATHCGVWISSTTTMRMGPYQFEFGRYKIQERRHGFGITEPFQVFDIAAIVEETADCDRHSWARKLQEGETTFGRLYGIAPPGEFLISVNTGIQEVASARSGGTGTYLVILRDLGEDWESPDISRHFGVDNEVIGRFSQGKLTTSMTTENLLFAPVTDSPSVATDGICWFDSRFGEVSGARIGGTKATSVGGRDEMNEAEVADTPSDEHEY